MFFFQRIYDTTLWILQIGQVEYKMWCFFPESSKLVQERGYHVADNIVFSFLRDIW